MNREEVKELMPILQAFLDHKELRRKHGINWVNDHDEIHLDQEYRIKSEPRVLWVYPMGSDEFEATTIKENTKNFAGVFKAIEVLEDD